MGTIIATACYRELGAELRKRREAAGLTEARLAEEVGWNATRISRIESGLVTLSEVDVIHYLAFCGIYGKHCNELRAMAREAERKPAYWLRSHEVAMPESACSMIYHEATATASLSYEPQFVPGLLQTEDYIRALTTMQSPNSDIERVIRIRTDRQRILRRPHSSRFTFFVQEQALRMAVGDPETMHDQLLALLLHDGLPHVAVRVVPPSTAFGGAFRLFEYPNHRPLVYLDGFVCGLFLEDSEYVDSYRELVPVIADAAFDERESREFLATLASDYDREGPDARVEEEQL